VIEIFFLILFILVAIFLFRKKYQEGRESLEVIEKAQSIDQGKEEVKTRSKTSQAIAIIIVAILVLALFNAWGDAIGESKKIIRTNGSGDCEDEVYPDGVKISNVRSDSSISFTSLQGIGKGRTNILSFYYKGTGGNVSLVVLPLKNLPQNQVNPSDFKTVDLTDEWTLYKASFCAPAECQFVVILSVPKGCEGEIKDFRIK